MTIQQWWKDDSGQALPEYGLIIAFIAAVAIAVVAIFGRQIRDAFTGASSQLPAPQP